jgi:DNA-binding transcriptional regulator LsrR (DeoR family)
MDQESGDLLRAVARLYYIDELAEREVARVVGVSRSKVSRLLSRAREQGIVRISVDEYDPRHRDLEAFLKERFGLNRAVVIKTVRRHSVADTRRTIGHFAAPVVSQIIRPGDVVGLAGGRTLAELIPLIAPSRGTGAITVVPLMGHIGPDVTAIDAIELSRVLAQRFGGTLYAINAPAFAPDARSRDVFHNHDHVRTVWRLFERMTAAFVGIGTLSDSAFIERGVLDPADIATLKARGAVGEICGRFFDADGQECDMEYRDRVISIGLDELRQKREVIAVTNGRERAQAIVAALTGGIIKSLVIDEDGAEAVVTGVSTDT